MKPLIGWRGWSGYATKVLSSQCELCGLWCKSWVCTACLDAFDVTVPRCQLCALHVLVDNGPCPECQWQPGGVASCLAVVSYHYPWQHLLAAFKYHNRFAIAGLMADIALKRPAVQALLAEADVVMGVPLSAQRIQARGYNQAHEWAMRLDASKTRPGVLLKCQHTRTQASLGRTQRQQQSAVLSQAFQVDPAQQHWVDRRKVLLVDDVQTTGTTLHAAALALRRAGASEVRGLIFARSERSEGQQAS